MPLTLPSASLPPACRTHRWPEAHCTQSPGDSPHADSSQFCCGHQSTMVTTAALGGPSPCPQSRLSITQLPRAPQTPALATATCKAQTQQAGHLRVLSLPVRVLCISGTHAQLCYCLNLEGESCSPIPQCGGFTLIGS